jgi:anti-sigma-K factor RskA
VTVLGEATWVDPLISALAGLIGALIGGGAVLLAAHLERRERREQEHRAALARYWAAVNGLGVTMATFATPESRVDRIVSNLEQRLHLGRLITRMFAASDAFWQAGGELRAVATADELAAINALEHVMANWKVGEPIPDAWTPAINLLRLRLEALGPD